MKTDIKFLNHRIAYYYNQRHGKEPCLKEGDEVFLLRKNIKTKQPSNKLDFKKLSPFPITKKINDVTFSIQLPQGTKLLNTFHISLLEPALKDLRRIPNAIQPEIEGLKHEDKYQWEVSKILESRYEDGT